MTDCLRNCDVSCVNKYRYRVTWYIHGGNNVTGVPPHLFAASTSQQRVSRSRNAGGVSGSVSGRWSCWTTPSNTDGMGRPPNGDCPVHS